MAFTRLLKGKDPARTPNTLARHLFSVYEHYRVDHLGPHNCNHTNIREAVAACVSNSKGLLRVEQIGSSLEGRSINLITCGKGSKRVLLWSQMHGDEYTATLALMDILNLLVRRSSEEKWIHEMLEESTLYVLPMLNPDGAERRQRRTAQNIDMNRDARALITPEAQLLRTLQHRLKPQFGFNLHDQELWAVGDSKEVSAIALLAPALDRKRSTPMVRVRAMRVAALLTRVLAQFIPKNLATYDDAFEPRAFGDNMQLWGTSTVLVESGHWPGDREKKFIRKLNFVGILTALRCIANGSYQDAELDLYKDLPQNGKAIYDIIVRDVVLKHSLNGMPDWTQSVDIGLSIPANTNPNPVVATVKDIGDLSTYATLETINGTKRSISSSILKLEQEIPLSRLLDALQLYYR
ncbi:MAG: peptidase M14 [Bacteroidetes bacterium]|nr:peptidase M14 [Bacteroidota bacterium]MCW5895805.1 peptidase M14 [Bacteroidota bacterium]